MTISTFDRRGRPVTREAAYAHEVRDLNRIDGMTEALAAELLAGRAVSIIGHKGIRRDVDPRGPHV